MRWKDCDFLAASLTAALLLTCLCTAGPAMPAEPTDPAPDETNKPVIQPRKKGLDPAGAVDSTHARASAGIRGLGAWLDRLFSAEDYEAELNESRAVLIQDVFAEEYAGATTTTRARIYLKLPGLNDKVRAEILGSADDEEVLGGTPGAAGTAESAEITPNAAAALAYFFRNDEYVSTSARIGLTFDGFDPNPYVGARHRRLLPLNEDWNFRFTERLRYYSLDGAESITGLVLERGVFDDQLFRASVVGTWIGDDSTFSYVQGFSLFHPLDEKSAIEYQLSNSFATRPHSLEQVTLRLRYRRQTWRDWLVVEVAPQLAFPRERDFRRVPGILFSLQATFGGKAAADPAAPRP